MRRNLDQCTRSESIQVAGVNGAFKVAHIKGIQPEKAAIFANAVAAIKCTGLGERTCLPTRAEVEEFLENQGIRDVRLQ